VQARVRLIRPAGVTLANSAPQACVVIAAPAKRNDSCDIQVTIATFVCGPAPFAFDLSPKRCRRSSRPRMSPA
jgi:hypothetical protein